MSVATRERRLASCPWAFGKCEPGDADRRSRSTWQPWSAKYGDPYPGLRSFHSPAKRELVGRLPCALVKTPNEVRRTQSSSVANSSAATVRPDLTTIVIIGDVTPGDARAVIEK